MKLNLVSYLVPDFLWFYEAVGAYLSRTLDLEADVFQAQCDSLVDPILLGDRVDLAFICGLPFIRYDQMQPGQLTAIAAPVMANPRYGDRPVYFTDLIVQAQSSFCQLSDLAGKTFCYNDPGSNSGYHLLRDRLFRAGYPQPFFSKLLESGFHQQSLRWVAAGRADCATIDSVVLEQEIANFPELADQLRVIESIGPRPIPPVVAAQHLDLQLIADIQAALLAPDRVLQEAMDQATIQRYAPVSTEDYAELGLMFETLEQAEYALVGLPEVSSP